MVGGPASLPLLYSFRRCPYAIRARLALAQAAIQVELREVLLRDKPESMLRLSPKGSVPVLQVPRTDGAQTVIDESIDVMHWALQQQDPDGWLANPESAALIQQNDGPFKAALDRYKYFTRHPEQPREHYRAEGEKFLQLLETHLSENNGAGLTGATPALADVAVFPFIRQFAGADFAWFASAPYPRLRTWLEAWVSSGIFARVMKKYPVWQLGDEAVIETWAQPEPSVAK